MYIESWHLYSVSHTTDDLVFRWLSEEKVPLFVDPSVELPQLELMSNVTGDCTSVYSTGKHILGLHPSNTKEEGTQLPRYD